MLMSRLQFKGIRFGFVRYEQVIGGGTRRCDDIGKTVFKIYDPVDIYAALQAVSSMKPLVKDTTISMQQLVDELNDPKSYDAPGSQPDTSHADDVLDALNQKLMRVLCKATKKAERDKTRSVKKTKKKKPAASLS
jgi:type I restriction enzyme, R subunit